jgi:hypothetical protein
MNWVTSTYRNLKLKQSTRFLLIFSICILAVAGTVWACSFEDDTPTSIFSPEAFVSKQYTPFFYDSENWYYGKNVEVTDNNQRFNEQIIDEWDAYLKHKLNPTTLNYLLLKGDRKGIDSVYNILSRATPPPKQDSISMDIGKLDKSTLNNLFDYLRLAKDCEKFAVAEDRGWYSDPVPAPIAPGGLEEQLTTAFNSSKKPFIKQRLLFQLVRYYYFFEDTTGRKNQQINNQAEILLLFNKYQAKFPQNLTYYRTLGYVAGYYRSMHNYALANYLYSRCYDFSYEMKIPSKFSFHPQDEADWQQTLKLAKNNEEKITLWHLLGMEYDPLRAIKEIVAIDPKSDKVNLLLSRVINAREASDNSIYYMPPHNLYETQDSINSVENLRIFADERKVVDSIALQNNTAKPYFWNIAAGYLHYIHKDYAQAGKFYAKAKDQLPADDKLVMAQYKMLCIFLDIDELQRIDAKTEAKLVEPLNWLKDVQKSGTIEGLRVGDCSYAIAKVYLKQRDTLKSACFTDTIVPYANNAWVQRLINLINKPNKTPFEKTMVRYYPHSVNDLYYHQAIMYAYKEDIDKAIAIRSKIDTMRYDTLPANPFNIHIQDCHDCDQAAKQKQKFTSLTFLKTLRNIKVDLNAGKDRYRNALLLANAYYNISYYGNNRPFYGSDIFTGVEIYSQKIAEKYYLLARDYAPNNEQKAKCTFMASKCEHNNYYSLPENDVTTPWTEKYFIELKANYSQTNYYKDVLNECGYFKDFVDGKSHTPTKNATQY